MVSVTNLSIQAKASYAGFASSFVAHMSFGWRYQKLDLNGGQTTSIQSGISCLVLMHEIWVKDGDFDLLVWLSRCGEKDPRIIRKSLAYVQLKTKN